MGAGAVLSIVDSAEPFVDVQPLAPEQLARSAGVANGARLNAEDLRRAGLAALNEQLDALRAAAPLSLEERQKALQEAGAAIGGIIAADAIVEAFAKAALEDAAAGAGLIRDLGVRETRRAIAAAIKVGKKVPADLSSHARREAPALSRPRPAAVNDSSSSSADNSTSHATSRSAPSSFAAGAPAAEGDENASSQMGDWPRAQSAAGGAGAPEQVSGEAREPLANGANKKPPTPPAPPDEDDDARNMRLAFYPLTDLGNAERFRERYRHRLLWNAALGWLVWDGKRWSRDGADDLVKIAEHDTVRMIQKEAKAVRESGCKDVADPKPGARDYIFDAKKGLLYSDKIASWGRSSEAVNKLGALSKRGAPYFAVGIDKLDADKMKINVNNGTLVVRRRSEGDYVEFRPHDPADLITKLAPVDFDPSATCEVFDRFLARVQPVAEMRHFVLQWLGLSLTGDVSEQKLAFLYGKGSNGKSVLIDAVSYVAGDYGETVPIETFLDHGKSRGAGQATPDLAILPGVRMLRTSEPEKNSKLAEAMVKLVTGGEPIQARHLNRDFFKFYPQFKLTISGNYRPSISGSDEGIWRRLRLVPFSVFIPKEERDIHLGEKLRAEASGILNRLLDGLRAWCDNGLSEPEAVTTATAEYRSASDPLGRFLTTCVVESEGDRVQSSVLHEVFEAWCKASGEKVWSNRGLSLAMSERGYKSKQSNVMFWLGIKLTKSVNDFVDSQGRPIHVGDEQKKEDAGGIEF